MRITNDDHALWQSFKNGDRKSFQMVYFSSFNALYEYGMRIARDPELVKDCIHDLFVKLWDHKANLANISAVISYLLVSMRAALYNQMEKNGRRPTVELSETLPFQMEFSVESQFIQKETDLSRRQKLVEAMNLLSPRQKEAIYLRYILEMDYEEIATIMNITVKGTYKLAARGLEALRQLLHISNSPLLLLLSYFRFRAL